MFTGSGGLMPITRLRTMPFSDDCILPAIQVPIPLSTADRTGLLQK